MADFDSDTVSATLGEEEGGESKLACGAKLLIRV